LESNVEITNAVRDKIQREFGVQIPVEVFFKGPSVIRITNQVLSLLLPNMDKDMLLLKEEFKSNLLPASLGYIYGTNWIQCPEPRKNAKLRLFMTPPAGFNPSFYRKVIPYFPETVEVCLLHLPGRTSRLDEKLFTDMRALAKDAADSIKPLIDPSNENYLPYAFFGHCMGGQINYEIIVELQRQNLPLPKKVFVCSSHAVHITNGLFPSYTLTDEGILDFIKFVNGGVLPKALENAETNHLVLNIMRADLQTVASQHIEFSYKENKPFIYHHKIGEELPLLNVSISAWGGGKDPFVPIKYIEEWKNLITGYFEIEVFPDADHYPYVDVNGNFTKNGKEILDKIIKQVEKIV
jgi:medium-chain acyl-[acyl-carrier-protein] hydrolase